MSSKCMLRVLHMTIKSQWERIGIQNRMSALDLKTQDGHVNRKVSALELKNMMVMYEQQMYVCMSCI